MCRLSPALRWPRHPGQPVNEQFSPNRFVLTGNIEGDFNVSLSMVNDVCDPAASYLLLYPTGDETTTPMHTRIDDVDRG